MSDLFGSPRRWIFRRRRLPQRRLGAERRCAAGQCNGYAHLSWRSADTGRGRDTRREASGAKKRSDAHQDSRASPFVRRCPAASTGAQRAGSSGGLARRAAHHVPPWSWARESPPEAEVELRPHGVACSNSAAHSRGYLGRTGSHTLQKMINEGARDIQAPEKQMPVWKRAQLLQIARAKEPEEREELRKRADLRIGALGCG